MHNLEQIDTLVFDYGGVIINIYEDKLIDTFKRLKVTKWKLLIHKNKIKRLKREFINGLRPTADILAEIKQVCGKHVTIDEIVDAMNQLAGELPQSRIENIIRLRNKYKVYVLSNINDTLWDTCVKQLNAIGLTPEMCYDCCFLSYEMKAAKPDPAIYQLMIQETGLDPRRTLYFDDRAENVEMGNKLGFHSILVNTNHLEESLSQLGLPTNL